MIPLEKLEKILITKDEYSNEAVNILKISTKKYLGLFQLEHNREKLRKFYRICRQSKLGLYSIG